MAVLDSIANQYTTLATLYPNARAKIWSSMAITAAERTNIFAKLEGLDGSKRPIWRKDDLKKSKGDTITFTTVARLGGQARIGSQKLTGAEEIAKLGTFALQIDFKRHATGLTEKHKLLTAIELQGYYAAMLGDHAGWTMENDMMMSYRQMAGNRNRAVAGNKGNVNNLRSADVLSPSLIESAGELGRTNQAKPVVMSTGKQGGWTIPSYLVVSPHPALTELRQTAQWQNAMQNAGVRGDDNPIFTGDFIPWAGHQILPHYIEDDDSNGPIGSAFAPKGLLGVAIAAGPTPLTIQGGYNNAGAAAANPGGAGFGPIYFGFFGNYDWQWVEGQVANPQAGDQFVLIYNMVDSNGGAAGDAGKWGFYRYQTNNGYTLTTASFSSTAGVRGGRLSATANGGGADTRDTTVGNVAWNAGLNTENHPTGSVIIQTNSSAVPYGYSVMLGAGSAMRGYGRGGIKKISQTQDYDFVESAGYQACYGQTPFYDTNGDPKRFVLLQHAIQYSGLNLPVVT